MYTRVPTPLKHLGPTILKMRVYRDHTQPGCGGAAHSDDAMEILKWGWCSSSSSSNNNNNNNKH
jgi:hypothetical protein